MNELRDCWSTFIMIQKQNFGKWAGLIMANMWIATALWVWALVVEPWLLIAVTAGAVVLQSIASITVWWAVGVKKLMSEYTERMKAGKPAIIGASYWPIYLGMIVVGQFISIYPLVQHYLL